MVDVVNQRNTFGMAERQQVGGREDPVVVFIVNRLLTRDDRRSRRGESRSRLAFVSKRTTTVDIDHV